ncbi:hypothetical protein SUGI_0212950 [Cryptomeria japonica]|nr:hypothetical protein SUGI_0212950 [Cryptomeria japonica]
MAPTPPPTAKFLNQFPDTSAPTIPALPALVGSDSAFARPVGCAAVGSASASHKGFLLGSGSAPATVVPPLPRPCSAAAVSLIGSAPITSSTVVLGSLADLVGEVLPPVATVTGVVGVGVHPPRPFSTAGGRSFAHVTRSAAAFPPEGKSRPHVV